MSASILAAVVLLSIAAVTQADDTTSVFQELPEGLQEAIGTFYESIETGDVEARVELLAEDVIMMPNHWTMSRGKGSVAEMLLASRDAVFKLKDREMVFADASGDMAYTVNSYYYTYHAKGDEPQWHKTKNIHVWRMDDEGRWRLQVDIWNSDVRIAEFAEE